MNSRAAGSICCYSRHMLKQSLLLIALFPMFNFLHEGGHWLGAKAIGQNPKMMLQRVDLGSAPELSVSQEAVYNWGGPAVNYLFFAGGYLYPPLAPFAFVMATHRLGPNVFASILYLNAHYGFTNDETKQFPKKSRLMAALLFSAMYLFFSIYFLSQWLRVRSRIKRLGLLLTFATVWFGYGVGLDLLDKALFSQA